MAEIVKAGPNTATYPMHAWMIEEIQAWERGVAASSALLATQNRYSNYLSGPFNSWLISYNADRASEATLPPVPEGFDAQMTNDGLGFDLVGSGSPSGPPPPYTRRIPPQRTPGLLPLGGMAGQSGSFDATAILAGVTLGGTLKLLDGRVFVRIA